MPGDPKGPIPETISINEFQSGQDLNKDESKMDAYGNPNKSPIMQGIPPQSKTTTI